MNISKFAGLVLAATTLSATAAEAAPTKTLRFYEKARHVQVTHADGTVEDKLPIPEPKAGDTIDVVSDIYRGDHRKHGRKRIGTDHLSCTFLPGGPPECISHATIGESMLVVAGTPPKVVLGTGRFLGATGRVVSSKEVKGVPPSNIRHNDIDVVLKLRMAS